MARLRPRTDSDRRGTQQDLRDPAWWRHSLLGPGDNQHRAGRQQQPQVIRPKILLDLASQHFSDDGQNFSKVLSMYILSALFKDTHIGEDVLRYAEQTLIIAICSFD
jgi:hypothetical protein